MRLISSFISKLIVLNANLVINSDSNNSLNNKSIALHVTNKRLVGCRAKFGLEVEGGGIGFVDFAEAKGVGARASAFIV